jgi:hypothetical protein
MGIRDEIYEGFLAKLEKDKEISALTIAELRKILGSGESLTQQKVFEAIKKGCSNGGKD